MALTVERTHSGLTNEPNVVPMIDILLVLLIIFMIVIPMSRKALDLQLPDPTPQENAGPPPSQIVLEVLPGNRFLVNKEQIPRERLGARLKQIYEGRPDKVIFIKGDPTLRYEDVIWAIDVARGSGARIPAMAPKDAK